jgi:hypothetical protein
VPHLLKRQPTETDRVSLVPLSGAKSRSIKRPGTAVACSSLPDGSVSLDVVTPRSLLDVRVDLLCLLPMLLGCGLFLTCSVCLLLSCKPGLLRLPATLVRLLAVLASFDTLLVELSRTLAPRDERHGD